MKKNLYFYLIFILAIVGVVVITLLKRPVATKEYSFTPLSTASFGVVDGPKQVDKPTVELINSQTDWEGMRKELSFTSSQANLPEIDFSKKSAVVVYGGVKGNGGNYLEIDRIESQFGRIKVEARLIMPGKNCLDTPYYTAPVAFSTLPKTLGKAVLSLKEVEKDCSPDRRIHVPLPL